ncbi:DUF4129 domain-containing protein [Haloferacaceae archaeon DSL9]
MERDTALTICLALLAVLAFGVAAATLDSAVVSDGGDFGFGAGGDGGAVGSDSDDVGVDESPPAAQSSGEALAVCFEALREPPAILAFVGVLALFGAFVYRETRSLFASGVVVLTVLVLLGPLYAIFATCGPLGEAAPTELSPFGPSENGSILPDGGGGDGGDGGSSIPTPTILLAALLFFALLASVVLLLVTGLSGDDEGDRKGSLPADDDATPEVAAIAQAAGTAADRIEADANVENEVYRAWRSMTGLLDVSRPESSTPAEFATAAVDAGMEPDDVRELTALFEEVRYGGATVTEEREARAVAALRRIESTYGEGE